MFLDRFSVWWILVLTVALIFGCLQIGIRRGKARLRSGKGKLEVSGAMVGAVMGLLSFLLAFTFNAAAARGEARKALVVKEANAIDQAWLRAGFLGNRSDRDARAPARLPGPAGEGGPRRGGAGPGPARIAGPARPGCGRSWRRPSDGTEAPSP